MFSLNQFHLLFDTFSDGEDYLVYSRSYKHFNQNEFESELKKVDWLKTFENNNTEQCTQIFFQTIDRLLDVMAPVHRLSRKEIDLLKRPCICMDN